MKNNFEKLLWLIGQWEGIQGSGIYHEEWKQTGEFELIGRAYLIKKGEIMNNEFLKIHILNGEIYYTADVSHNPEPVSFKLTFLDEVTAVFENPKHDFPQKITYMKKENNNLTAFVEANINGKEKKIEYNLRRIL